MSPWFLSLLLVGSVCCTAAESPSAADMARGKELYLGAGSCVACHMPDGKGQPGSIPPLAGSEWLESVDRSIAISLRGLAGPIKVNNKRFHSAMPPQLLMGDEDLAAILTYVNFAWGNKGEIVDVARVAKARTELPFEVYTPKTLLRAFPFPEALAKHNGTYTIYADDTVVNVTEPVLYRTFMPGASPAAFAVALPGDQFYCWDAGESRLRYVWTRGGFIKGNQRHWSSNGKTAAKFEGEPYYRAHSSLIGPEDEALLAKSDLKMPIYDTSEAVDFPFEIAGVDASPRFLGYRLVEGYPVFRVGVGEYEIREQIRAVGEGSGVVRHFEVEPSVALTLKLTPSETVELSASAGNLDEDGRLTLSAEQSAAFSVTMLELPPVTPVDATTKGGAK